MSEIDSLNKLAPEKTKPIVSVIVPVYNTEQWLSDCLDSIQGQTLRDIEIILVNDGSTDQSGVVLDAVAKKDDRISVFHTANQGVSNARNLGIDHARGKYISFVDSDDIVLPTYLETMLSALVESAADLSVCGIVIGIETGALSHTPTAGPFEVTTSTADRFLELNRLYLLYGPVCKMYRKELIAQHHIRFDPSYSYGEDLLFNFQYLDYVERIAVSDKALYRYRIFLSDTLSTKYYSDKFEIDMEQLDVIHTFFKKRNMLTKTAEQWLWTRYFWILHDSLFLINHPYSNLRVLEKYRRVKLILSHACLKHALEKADLSGCPSFVLFWIRIRSSLGFFAINALINLKRKLSKHE